MNIIFDIFRVIYTGLLVIMPCYFYYLGYKTDIMPAVDICVLYYLATHNDARILFIFIIGILLDTLHDMPVGSSSLAFISANYFLSYTKGIILIKNYYTNIAVFTAYSVYVLILRYIFSSLSGDKQIDLVAFIFHVLTTIAVYPIVKFMLELSLPSKKGNIQKEILGKK